jgi:hypothetical protein
MKKERVLVNYIKIVQPIFSGSGISTKEVASSSLL